MTRHNRYGKPANQQQQHGRGTHTRTTPAIAAIPHTCDAGWLDRDADHPRPCLICKPHLAPEARKKRLRATETTESPHARVITREPIERQRAANTAANTPILRLVTGT